MSPAEGVAALHGYTGLGPISILLLLPTLFVFVLSNGKVLNSIRAGFRMAAGSVAFLVMVFAGFHPEWLMNCLSDPEKVKVIGCVALVGFFFSVATSFIASLSGFVATWRSDPSESTFVVSGSSGSRVIHSPSK